MQAALPCTVCVSGATIRQCRLICGAYIFILFSLQQTAEASPKLQNLRIRFRNNLAATQLKASWRCWVDRSKWLVGMRKFGCIAFGYPMGS